MCILTVQVESYNCITTIYTVVPFPVVIKYNKTSKWKRIRPPLKGQRKQYGNFLGRTHCWVLKFSVSLTSSGTLSKSYILAIPCVWCSNNKCIMYLFSEYLLSVYYVAGGVRWEQGTRQRTTEHWSCRAYWMVTKKDTKQMQNKYKSQLI